MSKPDHAPGYVPNNAYIQADWDEVCDTPELTDAEVAELLPGPDALPPALAQAFRNRLGRPRSSEKAVPVSLRVPPDVLAAYKADGPGWQTRMNEALAAGLEPAKIKVRWRVQKKAFGGDEGRPRRSVTRKGTAA